MRCKQLFVVLLLGCALSAAVAATDVKVAPAEGSASTPAAAKAASAGGHVAPESQLKAVTVSAQAGATVVSLETAGAFTHSEYRPQPSMVLVDLQKVSSRSLAPRERAVNLPGVKSYRVLEYKSGSGVEVTRLELNVAESARLQVQEGANSLRLTFSLGETAATASAPAPAATPKTAQPAPAPAVAKPVAGPAAGVKTAAVKPAAATAPVAPKPAPAATPVMASAPAAKNAPARIRSINIIRNKAGVTVEIEGAKSAQTMRLSSPERLVLDIQDSFAEGGARTIDVNAPDLKAVRIGQYQLEPPVTRIVLDLTGPREFDLANHGNKLVVTVLPPKSTRQAIAAPASSPAPPPLLASAPVLPAPSVMPVFTAAPVMVPAAMPAEQASMPKPSPLIVAKAAPAPLPAPLPSAQQLPAVPPLPAPVVVVAAEPRQIELRSTAFESRAEQPGGATKSQDFVYVEPQFTSSASKTSTEPAREAQPIQAAAAPAQAPAQPATPPPAAISPAGARASEAATTIAQNRPPDLGAMPAESAPGKARPADAAKTQPSGAVQPAVNLALEQQRASSTPPPQAAARKYSGEPISVNLKDVDLRDFFRLIHEISGLNIVLDPSVKGTVTLVLDDVPWDQALDVVLQNNGLGRSLQGNVLRVATLEALRKEATEQRAHADAQALAVDKVTVSRFLSYARAKDLVPTLKKLLTRRGDVLADERTNALIISDIPATIPTIDRLLAQLDRKTLEVEIEARVVASTRSFAREIGSQMGFGWGNMNAANTSGTQVGGGLTGTGNTSPITYMGNGSPYFTIPGPQSGGTPVAQSIPLFTNLGVTSATSGIGFSTAVGNYRLDVLLQAAESRGLLKVLSRPRVVTQNNITAVVKQGVRLPITTASVLSGPPTVSYVDAFLRLTVTPQITIENTIFLSVDVENTVPDFGNAVQGNPALDTQQATTQILVTDGGTVMIGGVIQTSNSVSVKQVPFLGNVPILGNIFKNRSVSTSTQELIFFITPKIIQT